MSDLTPRQRAFLAELNDLVQRHGGPVHYSEVASSLGVNRFSAYDMLKVLEAKGMVSTSYALAPRGGPGRTQVLFNITARGLSALTAGEERGAGLEEWASFKARILQCLQEVSQVSYSELLRELLKRLPERRRPLMFCAEMVTVLLLNLMHVRAKISGIDWAETLSSLTDRGEAGLGALAGLSLGSAFSASSDHRLLEALYANVQRYQRTIHGLSEESQRRLSEFLKEAIRVLASRQQLV
ncbi:MAG: hypothetical protein RML36_08400 [Anaerolineae bacterium]|nr:hypothetical protein [Anaerolineae bacterium]MDW8099484.1 hypothetical protein [Anaerolineae bacterium]